MTSIIDIHTHIIPTQPAKAVWSCMPSDVAQITNVEYASIGIHPWYVTCDALSNEKDILEKAILLPQVVAVGEAGLDKLCSTPWSLQMEVFLYQAQMADRLNVPLIIHAVKTHNEIMMLRRKLKPRNAWVIHGFRGKPQLAAQCVDAGLYLSFGARFNAESLLCVPVSSLFFETDESLLPIAQTYQQAAQILSMDSKALQAQVMQNVDKVFFNG